MDRNVMLAIFTIIMVAGSAVFMIMARRKYPVVCLCGYADFLMYDRELYVCVRIFFLAGFVMTALAAADCIIYPDQFLRGLVHG